MRVIFRFIFNYYRRNKLTVLFWLGLLISFISIYIGVVILDYNYYNLREEYSKHFTVLFQEGFLYDEDILIAIMHDNNIDRIEVMIDYDNQIVHLIDDSSLNFHGVKFTQADRPEIILGKGDFEIIDNIVNINNMNYYVAGKTNQLKSYINRHALAEEQEIYMLSLSFRTTSYNNLNDNITILEDIFPDAIIDSPELDFNKEILDHSNSYLSILFFLFGIISYIIIYLFSMRNHYHVSIIYQLIGIEKKDIYKSYIIDRIFTLNLLNAISYLAIYLFIRFMLESYNVVMYKFKLLYSFVILITILDCIGYWVYLNLRRKNINEYYKKWI